MFEVPGSNITAVSIDEDVVNGKKPAVYFEVRARRSCKYCVYIVVFLYVSLFLAFFYFFIWCVKKVWCFTL